ncbi:MAG TPA: Ig-like domain-containing protein [Kofleriaceae bacterium]|nr:Ig-like domain-containing protein [Kofleriaceae bacterium]
MRVLTIMTAAVCGIAGGACSNLLGIDDPKPDFGGDGGPRNLVSIAIGPDPLSLPAGACQPLTATGMFDDGSSEDITGQTEFSIEAGAAATVTPAGLARALAEGTSTVTAKLGQVTGNASAQVVPAIPDHLVFGIGDFQLAQLQRARLHVLKVLDGGAMQDETANATYHTDNPAVAAATAPGQIDGGSQAGTATISVCLGGAREGTVKVTVAAKQCRPVINELKTGSSSSAADEWVEILNPCTAAVDVTGWTLVYRGATVVGGTDSTLMATLDGQLAPGEIRLYAGVGFAGTSDGTWQGATGLMGQNNGAVALRMGPKDMGPIADAVAYGAVTGGHPFIEGAALPALANDLAAQRQPFDGRDDDNGATDFMQVQPGSPRAPNAP